MEIQIGHALQTPEAAFARLQGFPAVLQTYGVTLTWPNGAQRGAHGIVGTLAGHVTGTVWVRERDVYLRGSLGTIAKLAVGEDRIRTEVGAALRKALC
jgi:hypothetical protein